MTNQRALPLPRRLFQAAVMEHDDIAIREEAHVLLDGISAAAGVLEGGQGVLRDGAVVVQSTARYRCCSKPRGDVTLCRRHLCAQPRSIFYWSVRPRPYGGAGELAASSTAGAVSCPQMA